MNRTTSIYLDLVRFLAAVVVLLTHLAYKRFTGGLIIEWRTYGNDAVMVFFVLSGYVIAHTVATRDRELVTAGVLLGYVLGTYSARKLGLRTTGNAGGTHNLLVQGRGRDFDAMLALLDRGLLVTELMGQGVNGVTGDYSRGAAGFWVEGGRIAYPVHEVTVAGNLRDMYLSIVDVGSDVDARGGIRTGSILVEQMTIAGE